MGDIFAIILSAVVLAAIGCPFVEWLDKVKKEMDAEDQMSE